GRAVLDGDSAWCVTLFAGMGVSAGLAGADLLGSTLARHPENIERALVEWERTLRPHLAEYQRLGVKQRRFFVPANRFEIAMRKVVKYGMDIPLTSSLLRKLQENGKDGRLKDQDIARV